MFTSRRNLVIASSVVLLHVAALWALQNGLLRRAIEIIVPVVLQTDIIADEPPPRIEPRPPEPVTPPVKKPPPKPVPKQLPPAPQPVAIAEAPPAPNAPTGVVAPQPPAPPIAAAVAEPTAPAPAPAPPRVVLPSSDADYLQNPKPVYPPVSKRLGEQGKVIVRVLIGPDGLAQRAELRQSSGFDRLDQSALATVLKWRYVPGKRDGVAEAMWFNVPINFVLE
ncbi:MAG TPA: energy transducer TonB [Ramlibacter sp.]|nr:energy transducer TonB [Ramlibacter sp.]